MPDRSRRLVVGVGNEYRRDDGFGPLVVTELAARRSRDARLCDVVLRVSDGEPFRLLDLWAGADITVVVDAVRDGSASAGRRHELRLDATDLPDDPVASSHAVGLGHTVALGRALGRMPRRLVVLAVAGLEFGFGTGLTPEVAAAVGPVADRACELVS